jgi:hypothetical protein
LDSPAQLTQLAARLIPQAAEGDQQALLELGQAVREVVALLLHRTSDRAPRRTQVQLVYQAAMEELLSLMAVKPPNARFILSVIQWKVQDQLREERDSASDRQPAEPKDPDLKAMKEYLRQLSRRERYALQRFYVEKEDEAMICADAQLSLESFRAMRALLRACFSHNRRAVA